MWHGKCAKIDAQSMNEHQFQFIARHFYGIFKGKKCLFDVHRCRERVSDKSLVIKRIKGKMLRKWSEKSSKDVCNSLNWPLPSYCQCHILKIFTFIVDLKLTITRQQCHGWSRSIKIYEMESFKVASAHTCCDCWRGCQMMNQSKISRQFELPLLLLIRPSKSLSAHALLSAPNWR